MTTLDSIWDIFERYGYLRLSADKLIKIYENMSKIGSLFYRKEVNENIELVIAGSRGEGIRMLADSDIDILLIQLSAMCFHQYQEASDSIQHDAIFELDFDQVSSGYCRLKMVSLVKKKADVDSRNAIFLQNIESSLEEQNGHKFLRNDRMLTSAMSHLKRDGDGWLVKNFVYEVAEGPAQPYECTLPYTKYSLKFENVLALKCIYPNIVNKWCDRERLLGWPSSDVVKKVRGIDVLVVPVGETEHDVMQWRISLVLGELELVNSFNDTQLKVYGALKMLAKAVLQKSYQRLSSYMMKNVVFWISERTDIHAFERNQFLDRVIDGLNYLKKCVYDRNLPNYMIPGKNLLKHKMSDEQREHVLEELGSLLKDSERILLRCPEIKHILDPNTSKMKSREIEKYELAEQVIISLYSLPPSVGLEMVQRLFNLKQKDDIIQLYIRNIFPIIRKENPFGFFHHICGKTDIEILAFMSGPESDDGETKPTVCELASTSKRKRRVPADVPSKARKQENI